MLPLSCFPNIVFFFKIPKRVKLRSSKRSRLIILNIWNYPGILKYQKYCKEMNLQRRKRNLVKEKEERKKKMLLSLASLFLTRVGFFPWPKTSPPRASVPVRPSQAIVLLLCRWPEGRAQRTSSLEPFPAVPSPRRCTPSSRSAPPPPSCYK